MPPSKQTTPFAAGGILEDLALLRASDVDVSSILQDVSETDPRSSTVESPVNSDASKSVADSYKFAAAARAAIRLHDRGDIDVAGGKVDKLVESLDDVLDGLQGHDKS